MDNPTATWKDRPMMTGAGVGRAHSVLKQPLASSSYRKSLNSLRAEDSITWRDRSFPEVEIALSDVGGQGWNLLDGGFHFPAAALKATALERNLHLMRDYCLTHDVLLAPHAKTTMSPELVGLHLDAGAWGITVANVQQARVFIHAGVRRMLIANPVVGEADFIYLTGQLRKHPDLQILTLVDSVETAKRLDSAIQTYGADLPQQPVLLEVGYPHGRAGARTTEAAIVTATTVHRSQNLKLVGVEGFEGLVPGRDVEEQRDEARRFIDSAGVVVRELHVRALLDPLTTLVSFGGSSFFDVVVDRFRDQWHGPRLEILLRSGCYLTHDHGVYARTSPFVDQEPSPLPALEVWAEVLSRPEPDLVIAGLGRRDVSTDSDLPTPLSLRRRGEVRNAVGMRTRAVNDQHTYVSVSHGDDVEVGDLMSFGVSHPCTTFDKWRVIPIVSDEYEVIDAARTYF